MGRILLISLTAFGLSCTLGCSGAKTKTVDLSKVVASSDIPAQRAFPTNPDINPCEDFYGYTCSRVDASFKLRDDRSSHDFAFNDSRERLLDAKKKYLADLSTAKKTTPRGHDLQSIYNACMNIEAGKKEEQALLKKFTQQVAKIKTKSAFADVLANQILTPDFSFLSFDTEANLDNPDINDVIFLSHLQTLPERSYYEKPEVYADFQNVITKFFTTIGAKEEDAKARAAKVASFEKEFSKTFPLPAEFRTLYNTRTQISRADLEKRFAHLPLKKVLAKLPKSSLIRDLAPENFKWVDQALDKTDLETLKDVYLFHAARGHMDDAYPEYFKTAFDFNAKHLGSPPVRPSRDERCTTKIMGAFTKEIDAELIETMFPNFPTDRVVRLAETVRAAIIQGMKENEWLSKQAQAAAIEKIKGAHLQLVKPLNDKEWDFNPKGHYSPTTPYGNERELSKNLIAKAIHELSIPRDRRRWFMGPLTVNAYYEPADNNFVLPMGILQPPFFDPALPDQANLGGLGAVVGHELGHGIDDKGALYDSNGHMSDWMTENDRAEFKRRGAKLAKQFDGIGHNGALTLGENIGDLVGLSFAYRAAFPAGKGSIEDKRNFFLQYGRLWCNVMRPAYKEMMLKTNPHSMGQARVTEQVKNQPGFGEAFSCKAGSPMQLTEENRVKIW